MIEEGKKNLRRHIREAINESFAPQLQNNNIYKSKYGYETIRNPIISDGFEVLKGKGEWFYTKEEFERFLNKQHYFSASYSACFDSIEDFNNSNENKESIMLFETGHELVGLWSSSQTMGKIVPKEKK